MRTLRRYLVLVALAFWLGGFTFYVSVVVPVGTRVLGSPMRQGLITRQVTVWLNLAGTLALPVLALDVIASRDPLRWRFVVRLALLVLMAGCQAVLFWLHAHLDSMLDIRAMDVSDHDAFYLAHRVYLWTHTVQWVAALVGIGLMLRAWSAEERP